MRHNTFTNLPLMVAALFSAAANAAMPGPAIHVPRANWTAPLPATSTVRRNGLGVKANKRRNVLANRRAHR